MELLSANVGRPRPNPWKRLSATGIDKRPVEGPVAVTAPGPVWLSTEDNAARRRLGAAQ
jgi:MOSC domain-containing protein YiiM